MFDEILSTSSCFNKNIEMKKNGIWHKTVSIDDFTPMCNSLMSFTMLISNRIKLSSYEMFKFFLVSVCSVKSLGVFTLASNEWLYVFGFATHILSFKAIQLIGKTDIYNVLATGTD